MSLFTTFSIRARAVNIPNFGEKLLVSIYPTFSRLFELSLMIDRASTALLILSFSLSLVWMLRALSSWSLIILAMLSRLIGNAVVNSFTKPELLLSYC